MDWLATLDFQQAMKNVEADERGDWYRDPWGWPESRWVLKRQPEILNKRLEQGFLGRAMPIDVAKENFSTRPAVVLDPVDRVIYQALVDRLSTRLIGSQPTWAVQSTAASKATREIERPFENWLTASWNIPSTPAGRR